MATFVSLNTAIAELVRDGQQIALEGFTHLIPFAAGHEIIRQRRRDLHLVRMTPDLIYDQLIGMGCASKLTFSWGGNPGVGSLHRLRDAVENAWPVPLALCEYSHAELAAAYSAGAAGLPSGVLQGFRDTDLYRANPEATREFPCPFSGTTLTAVPAIRPDVTILHAQRADRDGNVLLRGITGAAREAALAARALLVTVEEQVDSLDADMNAIVLPSFLIDAIAVVPGGAYPSYTQDYYPRDNSFYQAWDAIARERESFLTWMNRHVLDSPDHSALLHKLGVAA